MDTTRLIEIAKRLGDHYAKRAGLNFEHWQVEQDIEARKLAIVPPGGWSGKNADERKQAEQLACLGDETLSGLRETLRAVTRDQMENAAAIEILEAERRALEWQIRSHLAEALAGKGDNPGKPEQEFDTAVDDFPF